MKIKWNTKLVQEEMEKDNYKLLSEYKNNREKLDIKCSEGHIYKANWDNYYNKRARCPYCKTSKGEEKISEVLLKYKIINEREKVFKGCVYKGSLRFDFYLPNQNICIEYDGKQHFEPQDFSGHGNAKSEFKETQLRDNIKTQYCKDNNIKLIRIPYWDFDNIETILKKELNI